MIFTIDITPVITLSPGSKSPFPHVGVGGVGGGGVGGDGGGNGEGGGEGGGLGAIQSALIDAEPHKLKSVGVGFVASTQEYLARNSVAPLNIVEYVVAASVGQPLTSWLKAIAL